jgi:hypothetical protein
MDITFLILLLYFVLDFVTDTSSVPSNYVFDQILSPLAISASKGIYDDYYELAESLIKFAKCEGLLPYDQTLGGRFVEYLSSFESLPEDHPESVEAQRLIIMVWELYDHLSTINENASIGAYYSDVVTRDETTTLKANLTAFSTGICKDVVVSLADVNGVKVNDIGGGSGGLLDTCQRMSVTNFSEYNNIDLQPNDANGMFVRMVDKFNYEIGSATVPSLKYHQQDMNDYLLQVDNDSFYFSIHSYYYMNYQIRDNFKNHLGFSGIVHVSDLLFDGTNHETDESASLILNDNRITGNIGEFRVVDEPMVFADELSNYYPARFLNSLRASIMSSSFVSRSLVFWSNGLSVVSKDILAKDGMPVSLIPTTGFTNMRRTKIYELDDCDFFFLRKMGYYVSGKIDGVCGYLTYENGAYYIGFRDGVQFMVEKKGGGHPNYGRIDRPINVEVLYNAKLDSFQIWFISIAPDNYPDSPASRRKFWIDNFVSWSQVVETAKQRLNGLYFKQYNWIPYTSNDVRIMQPDWPPLDGIVINDAYGYFHGYWKPYHSADVWVYRKGDQLYTDHDGVPWDVIDDRCYFHTDGIHEVKVVDGKFSIIHSRSEKIKGGALPFIRNNDLFTNDDNQVSPPGAHIKYKFGDYFHYYSSYGRNYRAVMSNVSTVVLREEEAKLFYDLTLKYLKGHYSLRNGFYRVADFIASIRQKSAYEPQRLWLTFIKHQLVDPVYHPYEPFISEIGGELRAVIKFDDN